MAVLNSDQKRRKFSLHSRFSKQPYFRRHVSKLILVLELIILLFSLLVFSVPLWAWSSFLLLWICKFSEVFKLLVWSIRANIDLLKSIVVPSYSSSLVLRKGHFDPRKVAYIKLLNGSDKLLSFTSLGPIKKLSANSLFVIDPILFHDFLVEPRIDRIFQEHY